MLKQHNKRDDAWSAFDGKVYNITAYLPFHPGGEKELMRVAGRDGTQLFGMWAFLWCDPLDLYIFILRSVNTRLGECRLYVRFLSCWVPGARTILECGTFLDI